jgi:hypothetical protein
MKDHAQDQSMERLLRRALAAGDRAHATGACLDADTLSAWADGALTAGERLAAETHAADCARCQAVLAAMVRTELPAAPEATRSRMRQWLTWLTPVAAAATAVAFWVAVDRTNIQTPELSRAPAASAPAAPPVATPGPGSSNAAPTETESRTSSLAKETDKDLRDRSADLKASNERSPRLNARDDERAAEKPAERFRADELKRSDQERGLVPAPSRVPAAAPAAPPPPAAPVAPPGAMAEKVTVQSGTPAVQTANTPAQNTTQNAAQNAAQNALPQTAQTQTATPAGQTQQQARAGQDAQAAARQGGVAEQVVVDSRRKDGAAGRGAAGGGAAGARAAEPAREEPLRQVEGFYGAAAVLQVMSPDPSVRWRVLAGLTLQRSIDGGKSWQEDKAEIARRIIAGDKAETARRIIAGVAPSPTVCWLVGQKGLVMLTTDGRTWQQVPFPQAVDLKEVRASDARAAAITTSDGRVFSTGDGGKTWTEK